MRGTGFVRAREAETGFPFVTHGRRSHLDPALVQKGLRRGGIDHLLLRTDRPFAQKVRHFFEGRGLVTRCPR